MSAAINPIELVADAIMRWKSQQSRIEACPVPSAIYLDTALAMDCKATSDTYSVSIMADVKGVRRLHLFGIPCFEVIGSPEHLRVA